MTEPKTSYPSATNQWIAAEIDKGDFEGIEQRWVADLPEPEARTNRDGVALDLGAGIGLVTRVLATRYARVVAVEGNPALAEHWFANQMAIDAADRARYGWTSIVTKDVTLTNAIVGNNRMRVSDAEWWKSTVSDKPITGDTVTHEIDGTCFRLRELLALYRPDAIVMDIEGAEYTELCDVCLGAPELLGGVDDLIVELHPGLWADPSQRDNLVRMLSVCGYTLVRRDIAKGWPPGTEHPLAIEHDWLTRRSDAIADARTAEAELRADIDAVIPVPDYRLGIPAE